MPMEKKLRGLDQLPPVETTTINQRIYEMLRHAIMAGKFRPGESMTLRGLAAALGTSIMPARDAVLRLITERALETHGRSVRIPVHDIETLRDVERFRVALEGEAAALAAERCTPQDIATIEAAHAACRKAQKAGRFEEFLTANQDFHFAVYRAARSELLQSMIETLWLQIGPHLAALIIHMRTEGMSEVDLGAHDRLIAALKARDAEGARIALAADLKDSTDVYLPFRAPEPEPRRKRA